jgi:hypothetical protein
MVFPSQMSDSELPNVPAVASAPVYAEACREQTSAALSLPKWMRGMSFASEKPGNETPSFSCRTATRAGQDG